MFFDEQGGGGGAGGEAAGDGEANCACADDLGMEGLVKVDERMERGNGGYVVPTTWSKSAWGWGEVENARWLHCRSILLPIPKVRIMI